ncbi:transcription initiation factor TFIID subunit 4-like [Puma concolor]|uniref:Transcription initiation factor TFIID subunit 4-like n=1 Tax=Puma concolor TaxID=9696 RepID=A0A6P6IMI1_PUMCO|nr:transcription initiation factor TFIID subunit 4-like [Puma concolor]
MVSVILADCARNTTKVTKVREPLAFKASTPSSEKQMGSQGANERSGRRPLALTNICALLPDPPALAFYLGEVSLHNPCSTDSLGLGLSHVSLRHHPRGGRLTADPAGGTRPLALRCPQSLTQRGDPDPGSLPSPTSTRALRSPSLGPPHTRRPGPSRGSLPPAVTTPGPGVATAASSRTLVPESLFCRSSPGGSPGRAAQCRVRPRGPPPAVSVSGPTLVTQDPAAVAAGRHTDPPAAAAAAVRGAAPARGGQSHPTAQSALRPAVSVRPPPAPDHAPSLAPIGSLLTSPDRGAQVAEDPRFRFGSLRRLAATSGNRAPSSFGVLSAAGLSKDLPNSRELVSAPPHYPVRILGRR